MTYNEPSGATPEEMHERDVTALVREWGITEQEARDALARVDSTDHRLNPRRRRRVA